MIKKTTPKRTENKKTGNDLLDKIDRKVIAYCTIAVLFTLLGFLLDRTVIRLINHITFPSMNYIFITITTLGESYIFAFIVILLTVALIINRKPIMSFALSVATASLTQLLLKTLTGRPRPFEVGLTSAGIASTYSSFPSGHTIMFFSIIAVIGKKFPKLNNILWILAILIGFSRIYLGVHYLSDVIAGAFLGYGIGWIFMKLEERYRWNL